MSSNDSVALTWQEEYETGIDEIDFQHQYFLKLIRRIKRLLQDTHDLKCQTALIAELNAYARFHFISEENLMTLYGYPDIDSHKNHHYNIIQELSIKQANLDVFQTQMDIEKLIQFLVTWFIDHTTGVDKEFSLFLCSRKQQIHAK